MAKSDLSELRERCEAIFAEMSRIEIATSRDSNGDASDLAERHDLLFLELGDVQRALAEAEGQPFVLPLETLLSSHGSAPAPFFLGSRRKSRLIYRANKSWREEQHGDPTEINLNPNSADYFVVLTLLNSSFSRLGNPSLDCIEQSEFWDAGLKGLHFVEVRNSPLIDSLIEAERMAGEYSPFSWKGLKHILLYFHDESFECLCKSWSSALVQGSRSETIKYLCNEI
ncbi:MAG: hypothetical protein P1V97_32905 [Planctomycetota bacterium]|nr:hypothetical protein [Planctomycetota bacterium]